MLQYSLVMTVSDQYAALAEIGAVTLQMLGKNHDVVISDAEAKDIVEAMRSLPTHADVSPALLALRQMGFQLVALTNSSDAAVAAQLSNAGIGDCLERHLSVETAVASSRIEASTCGLSTRWVVRQPSLCSSPHMGGTWPAPNGRACKLRSSNGQGSICFPWDQNPICMSRISVG